MIGTKQFAVVDVSQKFDMPMISDKLMSDLFQ